MEWYVKLAIVVGYLVMGAFISGVSGNNHGDFPDVVIMIIWPICCLMAALMWFFSIPCRIGHWIYEKFF